MERLLIWAGVDAWRAEASRLELTADGVRAQGTQLGSDPLAYRLDYRLDAPEGFITQRLEVEAVGEGWRRRIELSHGRRGAWTCAAETDGAADLGPAGGNVESVAGALDCDLGLSPLTNLLPIRRHALHERPGSAELSVAWVSVPDLGLHAYGQRYEHVRRDDRGAVVRFIDLGLARGFVADLELDADGLVRFYPDLARLLS